MARYRFVLADGQMFESSSTPAKILKTYPDARITHTVVTDEVTGESQLHPYAPKASSDEDAHVDQKEAALASEAPVSGKSTPASKKAQ